MTPQRAREVLNIFHSLSKEFRSTLLIEGADWDSVEWETNIAAIHRFKEKRMTDQKERDDFDEDSEVDEGESLALPPQPHARMYNSALFVLFHGARHRVLLLKDGYEFDAAHSLKDVQLCELEADGYPRGGAAIALTVTDNHRLEFSEVKFETIAANAIVCGAIIYNERGLIAHLPIGVETQGGDLGIRGNP